MKPLTALILIASLARTGIGGIFPEELTLFKPYDTNPVFKGGGPGQWDEKIRERGWILKEDGVYHLWYTGYTSEESAPKHLGYATSRDGITWTRHAGNPLLPDLWVEDMMVVKKGGTYFMFAEGKDDQAQLLTSIDRIHWNPEGKLTILQTDGSPIPEGPFGTPTALHENDTWYLFYERNNDEAVWLATSKDLKKWKHVQDEPVLRPGPDAYDGKMIALNQIIKYAGRYYAYYHGLRSDKRPDEWNTNVAVSEDLIHWEKYAGNPIIQQNKSSGILLIDGKEIRMYTMHPEVWGYFFNR